LRWKIESICRPFFQQNFTRDIFNLSLMFKGILGIFIEKSALVLVENVHQNKDVFEWWKQPEKYYKYHQLMCWFLEKDECLIFKSNPPAVWRSLRLALRNGSSPKYKSSRLTFIAWWRKFWSFSWLGVTGLSNFQTHIEKISYWSRHREFCLSGTNVSKKWTQVVWEFPASYTLWLM